MSVKKYLILIVLILIIGTTASIAEDGRIRILRKVDSNYSGGQTTQQGRAKYQGGALRYYAIPQLSKKRPKIKKRKTTSFQQMAKRLKRRPIILKK